ncbi:MAG TPA: DUF1540 domain-containing protein [Armatimonadota bacterium]|nr:DUF1540 domain-containing protein [Armatimonadota bacterium]
MNTMPPVDKCDVENCFYNHDLQCHAQAINVGGDHPNCDTFIPMGNHIARSENGEVGACHVAQCKYNADLCCNAQGINVCHHTEHADCCTFEPK